MPISSDQDLYEQLVQDRIACNIPESLTQTDIAQRYKIDRGVLARTFLRLSEDGLIILILDVVCDGPYGYPVAEMIRQHFQSAYDTVACKVAKT